MTRQLIVPPGAGTDYDWANDHVFVKAPEGLSGGAVTVVEDTLKPGFTLARHHHRRMIEIFYVLGGEVSFAFDDESYVATPGTTVSIPPGVRHEVTCSEGATLLTIFAPGGFDTYLSELSALAPADFDDPALIEALNNRFDIWAD